MSNNSTSRRSFRDLFGQRMLCRLSGLLTLCWFTVAAQALYAQNPVISLTLKNATVREVIEAVKTQSGYSFWYRESEIDLRKRVSVEAHDQNVLKLLDGVLADQGILAKLEGRHIVLYKSDPAGRGREYQLKGRVETEAGDPIVGANVLVEGTTNGMVTNSKGEFALNVTAGARLSVSFIGYDAAQVEVGNRTHLTVVLKENNQLLDDVVVIGYGVQKKINLTGSIAVRQMSEIENQPMTHASQALYSMPGVYINQASSKPGSDGATIRIRGVGTMSSSSPMVLVDGMEYSLNELNPGDIETISVLKDAASAAVYGARGAFGVILVTTKNAQKDNIRVNYNGSFSVNRRTVIWEDNLVSDGLEWLDNFANFFQNDTRTPESPGNLPSAVNNRADTYSTAYHEEFRRRKAEGDTNLYGLTSKGNYAYYGSTNWLDMFYKDYNISHTHNLSISGSSDKVSYALSGRYQNQDGVYKIGNEEFKSYNLRSKGSVKIAKWATLSNNTSIFSRKYYQPMVTGGNQPILRQFEHRGQPIYTPYNEDGTLSFYGASVMYGAFQDGSSYQQNDKFDVISTTTLTLEPIKDVLKISGDFTYKAIRSTQVRISDIQTGYVAPGAEESYNTSSYKSDWRYNTDHLASNIVLTWTPKLGDNHNLNVMGGWNIEKTKYRRLYLQRKGLLYASIPSFELMDSDEYSVEDDGYDRSMVGVFGRINYTLLNRYIFEFAARYDGSSRFPSNQRWGFFPSGSIGWRLSEEPWMTWSRNWLDNFKIRANVGSLGNANVSDYSFMDLMSVARSGIVINGAKQPYTMSPNSFVPASLTWETVTTYDIGLDMDFLRNRLSFSGDYYWRYTNDMLINGPDYPELLGADSPKGNYGSLKTKGWEASLSWRDSFKLGGKPFNYNVKVSVWDSRTWVKEYYNLNGNIYSYYAGKELGEIWGFRTDGYFLSNEEANNWVPDTFHKNGSNFRAYAGDLKFIDVNGDGKIDAGAGTLDDHGDLERIGNESPRYFYGINLGANWNGIGLSLFFQGVGQRDWYPGCESGFFWGMYNRPYGYLPKVHTTDAVIMDYSTPNWVVTNASSRPYYTRQVAYAANRNVGPLTYENDYYMQDASYFRLKNITIDYTFPKEMTRKIRIENLKVYVSAENLFTHSPIYKHTKMFDPEVIGNGDSDFSTKFGLSGVGQGYSYPMLKTITIGLNVTF